MLGCYPGTLVVEKQISVAPFDSPRPEVPEEKPPKCWSHPSADDKPKNTAPKLMFLQFDLC